MKMYNFEDEKLIVGYIMGSLDEADESTVSQRLTHDGDFRKIYGKMIRSLRPILRSRTDVDWDSVARLEARGLAQRTIDFLNEKSSLLRVVTDHTASVSSSDSVAMSETMLESLQETFRLKLKEGRGAEMTEAIKLRDFLRNLE